MTAILKVDTIQDTSGNNIINESSDTITIGASGDTISIPSGATITNSGTATGFGGDNTPAFSAFLSSAQSIAANTGTNIICNSEDFDTDSAYNTSDGKFTIPSGEGGKYFFYATFRTNSSQTMTRCNISIYKNGSAVVSQFNNNQRSSGEASSSASYIGTFAAGDYVQSRIFQDSSSTVNAEANNGKTLFMGYKLIL